MKKIAIIIIILLGLLIGLTSLIRNVGENHIKEACILLINGQESNFPPFGIVMYDRIEELAKNIKPEDRNYNLKGLTKLQVMINICQQTQEYDKINGSTTENFDKAIYKVLMKDNK